MIHKTIIAAVSANTIIAGLISVYNDVPAIFPDQAPEKAIEPYIVFEIEGDGVRDKMFQEMQISFELWGFGRSSVNAYSIMTQLEYVFDQQIFKDDPNYSDIRTWLEDSVHIDETDPRSLKHTLDIEAIGSRKAWSQQV